MRRSNLAGGRSSALAAASVALVLALVLAGCSEELIIRGNMPDPEVAATIQAGETTREEVAALLGSPSTISNFEDDTWYYIGQKQEQVAFFEPEVLERSILLVHFDAAGMVQETKVYTLEDGRIIDPVSRETPTEGRELTLLQQLFGNLGKFPTSAVEEQ
ncbi:MAG TPA: outer membrane protein assembly factor BamE [Kiloniellales bacterium]|nr:outer membrane protein assembly factor BamE [Kiloniellales bacterium]